MTTSTDLYLVALLDKVGGFFSNSNHSRARVTRQLSREDRRIHNPKTGSSMDAQLWVHDARLSAKPNTRS